MPDNTTSANTHTQLAEILDLLRTGDLSYLESLAAIQKIFVESGEYGNPAAKAQEYLTNMGFAPPAAAPADDPYLGGRSGAGVTAQSRAAAGEILGDPATALGEDDPFAAYHRQRGLPTYGRSTFQNWQAKQFNPAYATYQASSALNPATTPVDFNAYLRNESPATTRSLAGKLFQQGRTGADPFGFQEQLGGTEENRGVGSALANLLESALRGRYAAPVAQRMAGWIPDIATQYQADTTGQGKKLLDFLNERLRLQ